MQSMKSMGAALAALLLAGAAQASAPAPSGAAALTGIQVQLVDLRPDDGQDPWISTLGGGITALQLDATRNQYGDIVVRVIAGPFDGLPLYPDSVAFHAQGIAGDAVRGVDLLSVQLGAAAGLAANGFSWFQSAFTSTYDAQGNELRSGLFEIGPWTGVIFSAFGTASVLDVPQLPGSWGMAGARLFGAVGESRVDDFVVDAVEHSWLDAQGSVSRGLSISLDNGSDQTMPLMLGAFTFVSLQTAPVPEPSTGALGLGGGLALWAWRRRRGTAADGAARAAPAAA